MSWRSTASNIYRSCIGITPSATLIAAVLYHEVGLPSFNEGERSQEDAHSPIQRGWMKNFNESIVLPFIATPFVHKRELRHVIVPCGNIDFDVYVLGTNHRTLRSNQDVKKLLNLVRPDVIFVELCRGREEMLYDESYDESEYYAAAEYRRGEQADNQQKMPFLLLGDRPYRVSDLRWWESLNTVASQLFTYLVWPFILPMRDRLWGHQILIEERDTFMAYELHKSCAYYIEQQQQAGTKGRSSSELNTTKNSDRMSTCTRLKSIRTAQKSSLTLNTFFQAMCMDPNYSKAKEPKQPSIVAIIGSNHMEGVCALLENERVWSPEILLDVVYTERYSRSHPYTLGIVNDVEEYDRGVREDSNRR